MIGTSVYTLSPGQAAYVGLNIYILGPGRAYRFCAAANCGRVGERCIMFIFGLVSGVVVGLLLEYALGPVRWLLNTMRVW